MAFFWNWFVRNPAFLLAAAALSAGGLNIIEWPLAMVAGTAGILVGDAGWHLARGATGRKLRREARMAEQASAAEARRVSELSLLEQDAA